MRGRVSEREELLATLGALGFGAVLCLRYPDWLTTPDMRAVYPMDLVRALIQLALTTAFAFGVLNTVLNRRPRSLGMAGMGLALLATLLGGAEVPIGTIQDKRTHIGLDWFVLNLFFLALLFVPLERMFRGASSTSSARAGGPTSATSS